MGEKIIIEKYNIKEIKNLFPVFAQDLYHIEIERYGYVHNTGIRVILTEIKNNEIPKGWKTFEKEFDKLNKEVQKMWNINNDFGYHK